MTEIWVGLIFIVVVILVSMAVKLVRTVEIHGDETGVHLRDRNIFHALISLILIPLSFLAFFLISFVLMISLLLIRPHRLIPIVNICSRFILLCSGVVWRIHGRENVDKNKSYVWMFNHQSILDIFVIGMMVPHYIVGVAAQYQFNLPVWGYVVKKWGNIPVSRKDTREAIKAIELARDKLLEGTSIMIAPEGQRTIDGKLCPFKKGAFHLAMGADGTILPVGIQGLFDVKRKTDWRIKPGRI
ncbi:MAG: lysophospholipid acyltransferase family protein, partial [Candidatus Marinimicrobia bacterium]|nr:lysophospholipid acyltransferase family protein [Candidatus Neomarinimicrobiota bacterium]